MGRRIHEPPQSEGLFETTPTQKVGIAIDGDVVPGYHQPIGQHEPPIQDVPTQPEITTTEEQLPLGTFTEEKLTEYQKLTAYQGLLKLFGKENMGENYRAVYEHDVPARVLILGRVGLNSEEMRKASDERAVDNESEGRRLVGDILGLGALVATKEVTLQEASAKRDAQYTEYREKFAGIQNTEDRKKELAKVNRDLKRLRESGAAV